MGLVEQVYAAAANAGLLRDCHWQPADSSPLQTHAVGFAAPDDTVFDGLVSATDYQMSYLASVFAGLAVRDTVEIGGVIYQVRDIRAVGDGSEMRAKLTRL
ncbi:MAG: hypothetical protein CGU28_05370 [Candidatus Dactylopiibacterium carminicum]|uniref:Uncharacterized protein n=1 Tax=Candidatus Dactylopiibacterium carminicum TaxID=857335 RepID=A0A272ETS2_9RHOO|nr:hypothetical protein [Candidatus Dactylopiibacterium carminicum]KAF7599458.1 hypothetical protein BGI27_07800 [Candidatus Dactylopiibacterium carminicum]PAS93499.1 MAG: hypothetical protein CGU29_07440 [Candidatus Dactylopiibacterium carminicum]PAS97344.1 MAG: hypothetical protein CGU28_05370 [Candidatus Dactylopiibacterium carminicum]PAS99466.1 MAG: hypothetical protein BSR46_07825 [Candidatus Dactylopiibacterium carminicum]